MTSPSEQNAMWDGKPKSLISISALRKKNRYDFAQAIAQGEPIASRRGFQAVVYFGVLPIRMGKAGFQRLSGFTHARCDFTANGELDCGEVTGAGW
jgi:hypothetical protein